MERKFSKLLFLLQMGLNDTKHLAEKLKKKISQSLEVPPYFQICRWLAFSARWGSSFIYVFRILQGSCKNAVEEEGKFEGGDYWVRPVCQVLCAKSCARCFRIHQCALFLSYVTRQKASSVSAGVFEAYCYVSLDLRNSHFCSFIPRSRMPSCRLI